MSRDAAFRTARLENRPLRNGGCPATTTAPPCTVSQSSPGEVSRNAPFVDATRSTLSASFISWAFSGGSPAAATRSTGNRLDISSVKASATGSLQ